MNSPIAENRKDEMAQERCVGCNKRSMWAVKPGWICLECRMNRWVNPSAIPLDEHLNRSDSPPEGTNERPTSEQVRYPNLQSYINLVELAAKPLTIILAFACFFSAATVQGVPAPVSWILMGSGLILGFITYIVLMAGIDFLRVIVDIESSARRTSEVLLSKSKRP